MALTKIDDRGLKTPIDLQDNEKIRLGTGNDLQIYHDGSHTFIENSGTGNLILESQNTTGIRGAVVNLTNVAGNANLLLATAGGSVELYHNNIKQVETSAAGFELLGHTTIADDKHIRVGTNFDMHLMHASSANENRISTTQTLRITNSGFTENLAKFIPDGAVELYYDNSKKFETTSSGIKVTGDASTGTIIQGAFTLRDTSSSSDRIKWIPNSPYALRWSDNFKASFGSGDDLQLYHDGTHSYIYNTTGELKNRAAIWKVVNAANSEIQIKATENAAVELYYDNVKKFETTSYGTRTTGYHTQSSNVGFQGDAADWTSSTPYMHNMALQWNSGHFVNSTGVFTCPVAGKYLCSATVQAHRANNPSGSSGTYFNVIWQKNNSNYHVESVGTVATDASALSTSAVNGKHGTVTATVIIDCAANDTIRAHSNHGYRHNTQNICSVYLLG